MANRVERTVDIAGSPDAVFALVSDLPGMGRFSPENTGGRWVQGDGPAVGAVFRGSNAQGWRRWSTRATVVRCEPGRAFAFRVSFLGTPVAEWAYALTPTAGGCAVTESWQDRRSGLFTRLGALSTGVQDREGYTAKNIEQTLHAVKAAVEAAGPA